MTGSRYIGPEGAREAARYLGGFRRIDWEVLGGFVAHYGGVLEWEEWTDWGVVRRALGRYIEHRGRPVFRCRVRRRKISWKRARELISSGR